MVPQVEERIENLLDQLENPGLTSGEIRLIREKIDLLRSLEEK